MGRRVDLPSGDLERVGAAAASVEVDRGRRLLTGFFEATGPPQQLADATQTDAVDRVVGGALLPTTLLEAPPKRLWRNLGPLLFGDQRRPSAPGYVSRRTAAVEIDYAGSLNLDGEFFHTDGQRVVTYDEESDITLYQITTDGDIEPAGVIEERIAMPHIGHVPGNVYLDFPWLYVPIEEPQELHVYDISGPAQPELISTYTLPGAFFTISFREDVSTI